MDEFQELILEIQAWEPGALKIAVRGDPNSLIELLTETKDVCRTANDFESNARSIGAEEARRLIVATLHRSMAYSSEEYMPIDKARAFASRFLAYFGSGARFLSTCCAPPSDDSGISGWYYMMTRNTFESVLYCVSEDLSALLVSTDED